MGVAGGLNTLMYVKSLEAYLAHSKCLINETLGIINNNTINDTSYSIKSFFVKDLLFLSQSLLCLN